MQLLGESDENQMILAEEEVPAKEESDHQFHVCTGIVLPATETTPEESCPTGLQSIGLTYKD